jgi:hypothetical protein
MPVSFGRPGVGLGAYYGNRLVSPYTGVVLVNSSGNVIGGMTSFDIRSDRRTEPIRIIDLFNAGRIFERVLQPEEIRITGNAVLMYFNAPPSPNANTNIIRENVITDYFENYGIGGYNYAYTDNVNRSYYGATAIDRLSENDIVAPFMLLNTQFAPFNVIVFVINPARGDGVGIKFIDCYISSYSAGFRIETAYVVENIDIAPTTWELQKGDDILSLLNVDKDEFQKYLYLKRLAGK